MCCSLAESQLEEPSMQLFSCFDDEHDRSASLLDAGVSFRLQYQATLSSLILLKLCTLKSHTTVYAGINTNSLSR